MYVLTLNLICIEMFQLQMNLCMNMLKCEACNWTKCLCASRFSLCLALSTVTAKTVRQVVCFVCVCVCVRVKYLCIALVMCFGDAPVVRASLPSSLFPSNSSSLSYIFLLLGIILQNLPLCFPLFLSVFLHLPLLDYRASTPLFP